MKASSIPSQQTTTHLKAFLRIIMRGDRYIHDIEIDGVQISHQKKPNLN